MLFNIGLPDKYFREDGVIEGDKPQIHVMEIVPDPRFKALTKFAESTDTFLAQLRNKFFV
jgi:hypothetical protein